MLAKQAQTLRITNIPCLLEVFSPLVVSKPAVHRSTPRARVTIPHCNKASEAFVCLLFLNNKNIFITH